MFYIALDKTTPRNGTLTLGPNGNIINMSLDLSGTPLGKPKSVLDQIEEGDARIYNRELPL